MSRLLILCRCICMSGSEARRCERHPKTAEQDLGTDAGAGCCRTQLRVDVCTQHSPTLPCNRWNNLGTVIRWAFAMCTRTRCLLPLPPRRPSRTFGSQTISIGESPLPPSSLASSNFLRGNESFEITPQPSVQAQEKHEDKQVKEAEAGQVNEDSMETDDAPAV